VRTKGSFDFGLPYNGMNNVLVMQKNVGFHV
jgi:hypothetical protein